MTLNQPERFPKFVAAMTTIKRGGKLGGVVFRFGFRTPWFGWLTALAFNWGLSLHMGSTVDFNSAKFMNGPRMFSGSVSAHVFVIESQIETGFVFGKRDPQIEAAIADALRVFEEQRKARANVDDGVQVNRQA